ncbi:sensor histidine kinase [Shewanella algae]|uniref:sensor histidine kinase n=1 Tax=Shewanella algae TaxID=38313 RepID=UPI0008DC71BC|nr:histidine kinase [Shewanella algae]MBO2601153.1 sensor histidine kinase [Shewanella algae]OHY51790.1 hypothetical protein BEH76_13945 [Shewanella algae]
MQDPQTQTELKLAKYYLVNLAFYFIPLFIMPVSPWQWLASLLVLPPFIYCYFRAYGADRAKVHWPILGIILLAILITPANPGSLSLFTFAAFFIGFFYPLRLLLPALLLIALVLLALNQLLGFNGLYFVYYGCGLTAAISLLGVAERKRQQAKRQARRSEEEIRALATMLERERIGRDLHDLMGHQLSSIALKAELANKLLQKNDLQASREQLTELAQIARDSLSQIRRAVADYRHQGLDSCCAQLCRRLREKGLAVSLEGELPVMSPLAESQLILILTELVSNILRHSDATEAHLSFTLEPQLTICLRDNGTIRLKPTPGNGLKGIAERLALLGGELQIDTAKGFSALLLLPRQQLLSAQGEGIEKAKSTVKTESTENMGKLAQEQHKNPLEGQV